MAQGGDGACVGGTAARSVPKPSPSCSVPTVPSLLPWLHLISRLLSSLGWPSSSQTLVLQTPSGAWSPPGATSIPTQKPLVTLVLVQAQADHCAMPTSPSFCSKGSLFPFCELGLFLGLLSGVFYIAALWYFIPLAGFFLSQVWIRSSSPVCVSGGPLQPDLLLLQLLADVRLCTSGKSQCLGRAFSRDQQHNVGMFRANFDPSSSSITVLHACNLS